MTDDFFDLSARVGVGYARRPLTQIDGIGVHHTVSGGQFIGIDNPALTIADEIAHVLMIDQYHQSKGYGGIGYSAIVFASGRVYWMGSLTQQRAGIGGQNWHVASWAFAADLTTRCPTPAALAGGARIIRRIMDDVSRWDLPIQGHRTWVTDPAWATDCPGPLMGEWMPGLLALVERGEQMPETDWVNLTTGLLKEAAFIDDVLAEADELRRLKDELETTWRRSFAEPPLDHATWAKIRDLCDRLAARVTNLKGRALLRP